jgi:putative toxin-antitoxin system antitoxin component (TIGR02293 family)
MPSVSLLTFPYDDNLRVAGLVEQGLPARALRALAEALNLSSVGALAPTVNIPRRTLERRLAQNAVLKLDEAERAVRVARLFAKAVDVFEDRQEAAAWFSEPLSELGGKTPLECCALEAGAREVEQTLGRIEHGVFS